MSNRIFKNENGFTIIEIILVVGIIATLYLVAAPQFQIITGADQESRLGRLMSDIRSAYDQAVLSGMPHRIVFYPLAGKYHLEISERKELNTLEQKLGKDPTAEEEKYSIEEFKTMMEEYEKIAGEEIKTEDPNKAIKPLTPLLVQKMKIAPNIWIPVVNGEWDMRELGSSLMITSFQVEHLESKILTSELGPEDRVNLYFFPAGYVERAIIQISEVSGGVPDPTKPVINILTKSLEGEAEVRTGNLEMDIHAEPTP